MDNPRHRSLEDRFSHTPVPGEREPDALVGPQAGTVSGVGFGVPEGLADLEATMDHTTIVEHLKEGGGNEYEKGRAERSGD